MPSTASMKQSTPGFLAVLGFDGEFKSFSRAELVGVVG